MRALKFIIRWVVRLFLVLIVLGYATLAAFALYQGIAEHGILPILIILGILVALIICAAIIAGIYQWASK